MKGLCVYAALLASCGAATAAQPTKAQLEFFENKVRPVLAKNCYSCHSTQAEKVKGGLLLDSREALLKGGDSGAAIVPGNAGNSLLIKAIQYSDPDLQMPPKNKKLTDTQIADLVAWVNMGAPDPRLETAAQKNWVDPAKKHWAYQPVRDPAPPQTRNKTWGRTAIDTFVLAKLEEKELTPNGPAGRETLIRRAYFDLIGLPPTPDDVASFVADKSPEAFEKVIDQLLASPRYGERWGRHWLDVARYSDTKGEIRRQREDPNYPFAWTYRDYVIRSFNEDKPYNLFVAEQIAADKLAASSQNKSNLTALGFLTVGERFQGMQHDIINDRIDVVTKGFQAITVSCARCHDHKFDPVSQKDYYSLHGIFASSVEPEIEPIIEPVSGKTDYKEYYTQRMALQAEQTKLEARFLELRRKRDREGVRLLQREFRQNATKTAKLEMEHPGSPARAMVVNDAAKPRDSAVFIRGEAGNKGEIVPRRYLEIIAGPNRPSFKSGSGRLELANAIATRSNPLTARVMVNRAWMHHFGEGLVNTPDDFGTMSETPSHPELLDWLASRFMNNGWSLKVLHKLIMSSAVYQQSSENHPQYTQVDPGNRLLWRANIRRLEFEPLRDSLLAIGGTLDTNMYGRPVDLFKEPYSSRRSVYGFIDRQNVADTLVNFDFATPDMASGKRHQTTVPQQALFFMNNPLVIESAKRLVARPEFTAISTEEGRIRFLYAAIYQRAPGAEELELGLDFVAQQPSREKVASGPSAITVSSQARVAGAPARPAVQRRGRPAAAARAPLTAWQEYAHALLQANEFSFVN